MLQSLYKSICFALVIFWLVTTIPSSASPKALTSSTTNAEAKTYLPLTRKAEESNSIIVNHLNTDVHDVPVYWINEAKKFVVHYAHTSHGSQVLDGLRWLEGQDSRYNVDIRENGEVVIPSDTTALRIYDGNNYPYDTYITPDMYWETDDGKEHTRSVVDTGLFDFSLWTWCGQMSYYNDSQIQTYLEVMSDFESEYPGIRFIYYTGHTDGTGPGDDLWRHNDMARSYVQEHQKVLFDFADIEAYAPDGSGPYYNNGDGYCEWCDAWCNAHPGAFECQNLPSCAHTHGLFCTLKGQAFWALMARFAGWDGNSAP